MRTNPSKLKMPKRTGSLPAGWKTSMTVAEYERYFGVELGGEDESDPILRPEIAAGIIKAIGRSKQESVLVMTLDGSNRPINIWKVTEGLVNQSQIHDREIFAPAIEDRAVAIIFVHNHPSGSLEASPQDRNMTTHIKAVGDMLGIRVLDSLIVTHRGWISIKM